MESVHNRHGISKMVISLRATAEAWVRSLVKLHGVSLVKQYFLEIFHRVFRVVHHSINAQYAFIYYQVLLQWEY